MRYITEAKLKEADVEVYNIIEEELKRQTTHLEMIASENFTSPAVMEAMGSVFTNKYAEGYPYKRYYGGCEQADKVEQLAIDRACEIFGCKYANVQPHSGSQANGAVYAALIKAGDKILGMDLSHGGHLTHGSKPSFSGQNYQAFYYGVELDGRINYDKVEEIAKKINSAIFPGLQGGPLVHVIAAKAVAFKEILDPKWKDYAKQVKANAKVLGEVLTKRGYDIVSGGTDNHLVLVSFLNKPFSGKDADAALGNAGITVNKNTVPGETRSPFVTSGIRIGSPALTARGMKEKEFELIANKICDVLDNINNTSLQAKISKELEELSSNFVIYNNGTY